MEAKNLRGVHPGDGRDVSRAWADTLEEETTVAIDGELHEIGYFQPVPPGAEVFFIPKIEGG